jgi:hypothetical protein
MNRNKVLGLLGQGVTQLAARYLGQAGIVFHKGGEVDLSAGGALLQHQHASSRPGQVQSGGEPSRAASHYDHIGHHGTSFPSVFLYSTLLSTKRPEDVEKF